MCTKISHTDLITIHHEMGHIGYFMQYKNQPYIYRDAANPGMYVLLFLIALSLMQLKTCWTFFLIDFLGFHEAIGDTMALAVNTPTHLREIGLLPEKKSDYESKKEDIAYLFHVALKKVSIVA